MRVARRLFGVSAVILSVLVIARMHVDTPTAGGSCAWLIFIWAVVSFAD